MHAVVTAALGLAARLVTVPDDVEGRGLTRAGEVVELRIVCTSERVNADYDFADRRGRLLHTNWIFGGAVTTTYGGTSMSKSYAAVKPS